MSGRTAPITGVTGQDSAYLSERLPSKGYPAHGITRRPSSFGTERRDHPYANPHGAATGFTMPDGDMTDGICDLAAQSPVQASFETPRHGA